MQAGLLLAGTELTRESLITLGTGGLFLVAILEFYGLPAPPDTILIPLAVARPELAALYVGLATFGSIAAGLTAHVLGKRAGRSALVHRFRGSRVERAEHYLARHGTTTLTIGAFAPIPEGYEILSILSGVVGVDARTYLGASLLGRGGRYAIEALGAVWLGRARHRRGSALRPLGRPHSREPAGLPGAACPQRARAPAGQRAPMSHPQVLSRSELEAGLPPPEKSLRDGPLA